MSDVVPLSSRGLGRHLDPRQSPASEPERPWWASVIVCRSCCCGTTRKHPDTDHDRQLDLLGMAAADAGSVLRVSGCQGICHFSNLVVLRHRSHRITIGQVLGDEATAAVTAWIRDPHRVPDPKTGVVLIGPVSAVVPSGRASITPGAGWPSP